MRHKCIFTVITIIFVCNLIYMQGNCSAQPYKTEESAGIFFLAEGKGNMEFTGIFLTPEPSYLDEVAAKDLQEYLQKFTGIELPICSLSKDKKNHAGGILIGKAALNAGLIKGKEVEAVGEGGYFVRCKDGCLAIAGLTGDGTVTGIYGFLEQMGVKFLSEEVALFPVGKKLVVPAMELSRKPFFKFRNIPRGYRCWDFGTHSYLIADPRELGAQQSWHHTANFLVNYDRYHNEHAEYFAVMRKGVRLVRDPNARRFDVHVCMTNPEVRRVATENMLQWIKAQPDRKYFMVSQGDGRGDKWCQCEKCQAMDAVPGIEMTDRLLDFVNHIARKVAEKYPDKILFTLSYTEATGPVPVRVKPETNVRVMYCPYPYDWGCQSHAFCEQNRKGMRDLSDWVRMYPKQVFIFDYPVGYRVPLEIMCSFYAMVDKIRYYGKNGIEGIYFCGTPRNFNSVFKYVMGKLMWDPNIDVEEKIDEFMNLYYGKEAGPIMRKYFDLIYREVEERPVHQMCEGNNPELATEEFAEKSFALFERMEKAAASDEEILKRILDEKVFLLFCDLNVRNKVNGLALKNIESYADKLGEFTRLVSERRITQHERRTPIENFFWETARIRFEGEPWYNDPKVDEFLADPLAMLK